MSNEHLNNLAQRVEDDPFFLGCALQRYAKSDGFTDHQLADVLGCAPDQMALLCLCRAPESEPALFQKGIAEIAAKFHLRENVLADAVRRGQAILQLARLGKSNAATLAAARDGKAPTDTKHGERGGR